MARVIAKNAFFHMLSGPILGGLLSSVNSAMSIPALDDPRLAL